MLRLGAFWIDGAPPNGSTSDLVFGELFSATADFQKHAVRVAEPEPVQLEALRRIELLDAHVLKPFAEGRHVLLETAEGDELQRLLRTLGDAAPFVGMAVGVHQQAVVMLAQVEAEFGVEVLGRLEVGHHEIETVERVHP